MRDTVPPRKPFRPLHALAAAILPGAAGTLVALATLPEVPTWYATLQKPSFTPPNGAFGPAWTTLYILMAYAFYRVLATPANQAGRTRAVMMFTLHMVLNGLWSVGFFGMRNPEFGLADMALLWPVAVANIFIFARLDRVAGLLMVPNALWVTFAAVLNIAIWRLN